MHFLDGEFAKWVNRKRKRSGHLFQGRFHSFLIEKEAYLMEVMRYVALNPVRAKLVARPEEWRWSSYRAAAGFEMPPLWLETDWILAQIRSNRAEAQQVYREFVCEKIGDKTSIWDNVVNQIYLGTETWVEMMRGLVESTPRSDEHPQAQRAVGRPAIQKVVRAVANVFDIDRRDLQEGHGGAPRSIVAWLARYEGLTKLRPIAATLRLRSSGHVSDLIPPATASSPATLRFVDSSIAVSSFCVRRTAARTSFRSTGRRFRSRSRFTRPRLRTSPDRELLAFP